MKIFTTKQILGMTEKQAKIALARLQKEFVEFDYDNFCCEAGEDERILELFEEVKKTAQVLREVRKGLQ